MGEAVFYRAHLEQDEPGLLFLEFNCDESSMESRNRQRMGQ
jgi:hypothetical protein